MALPASLSAFLGITEPAIFGVNIRYMKPFVAGCIGGACGALIAGITGAGSSAYGITGLFGFLITTDCTVAYLLVIVVAAAVAFIISWILYKETKTENQIQQAVTVKPDTEKDTIYVPAKGKVIALSEVKDDTFAGEVLGKGVAIYPEEGKIYAPFDGTVTTVFDTRHAIGMTSKDGIEVLIHVGINTVMLNGEGYECHVAEGDVVKAGTLLLDVDLEKIKSKGYDVTTPVIVTNTDDFAGITVLKKGDLEPLDAVMKVER